MRKLLVSLMGVGLLFAIVAPMTTVHAATLEDQQALIERLQGQFLLAVEDFGRIWFVLPANGNRVAVTNKDTLMLLMKQNAVVIGASEMKLIPVKKQTYLSASAKKAIAARAGHFVTTSKTLNNFWYVNPSNGLRYDMGTADKAFAAASKLALGVTNETLTMIPVDGVTYDVQPTPETQPVLAPAPQQPIFSSEALVGWNFVSGLWQGYEQYHRAFNDWLDIKWFNNIVSYNLPIYFNENGFSLDSGNQNFFVWSDFSPEWKDFYENRFSMKTSGDMVYIKFDLPQAVVDAQYGTMIPGTYYFTNTDGLLNEKQFKVVTGQYQMSNAEKAADAKRVFTNALAVANALNKYHDAIMAYPIVTDAPIELGQPGLTALCLNGGFGCDSANMSNVVYLNHIDSARPTTHLMYDSRWGGSSYALTFAIYGTYDQYDPGVYEITPYTLKKIAEITLDAHNN